MYVAQPEVKPGCVLRQSSVNELEKRKLVTDREVSACVLDNNKCHRPNMGARKQTCISLSRTFTTFQLQNCKASNHYVVQWPITLNDFCQTCSILNAGLRLHKKQQHICLCWRSGQIPGSLLCVPQ